MYQSVKASLLTLALSAVVAPVTGNAAEDDAAFEARLAVDPFAAEPAIPGFVRSALVDPCISRVPGAEDCALMRVPQTGLPEG